MFRVLVGASRRLRWGFVGLVSAFVLRCRSRDPPMRAGKRNFFKRAACQRNPTSRRYAAIVVDANTGAVLHQANPDAPRHPASLTKIMTLYLLFERLEAGKITLDSRLQVSEEAAAQAPTKLGLRPGQTLEGRRRDQGARHQIRQRRRRGDRRSARPAAKTNSPR